MRDDSPPMTARVHSGAQHGTGLPWDDDGAVTLELSPQPPVLKLVGELDIANQRAVRCALAVLGELPGADAVIDLSEATFLDASTVGALRAAHDRGMSLYVRGAHGLSSRVLEISGATRWMRPEESAQR